MTMLQVSLLDLHLGVSAAPDLQPGARATPKLYSGAHAAPECKSQPSFVFVCNTHHFLAGVSGMDLIHPLK